MEFGSKQIWLLKKLTIWQHCKNLVLNQKNVDLATLRILITNSSKMSIWQHCNNVLINERKFPFGHIANIGE